MGKATGKPNISHPNFKKKRVSGRMVESLIFLNHLLLRPFIEALTVGVSK